VGYYKRGSRRKGHRLEINILTTRKRICKHYNLLDAWRTQSSLRECGNMQTSHLCHNKFQIL